MALRNYVNPPNQGFSYQSIANIRTANMAGYPNGAVLTTAGYTTSGDGGGGDYYIDTSDTTTADNGGSVIVSADGIRCKILTGPFVNVLRFGAVSGSDSTSAIQAAITYAESFANALTVDVPAGEYLVTGLTLTVSPLRGIGGNRNAGSQGYTAKYGATLTHKPGATSDLLTINPAINPNPSVRNIYFKGNREQNLKTPITISAVASRTRFTVPTASLPAAPASPGTYPYYGYCFFYSAQNRYLGSGLVTNIDYGTGVITLETGSDYYATLSTAAGLLSVGYKVCFSSSRTETANFKTTTGVDNTAAGYCGIRVAMNQSLYNPGEIVIEDCYFDRFHCGLALGNVLIAKPQRLRFEACSFAGMASVFPGDTRDGLYNSIFSGGYYWRDVGTSAETGTFIDSPYRNCLFGWYGLDASCNADSINLYYNVHGLYSEKAIESNIGMLLLDQCSGHGLIFGAGTGLSHTSPHIASLILRNNNSSADVPTTLLGHSVIKTRAAGVMATIDTLQVVKFGTARYFDDVFNLQYSGELIINNLADALGATTLYNASSTYYPFINAYQRSDGYVETHANSNVIFSRRFNTGGTVGSGINGINSIISSQIYNNTNQTLSNSYGIWFFDTSSGALTATLPLASNFRGQVFELICYDSGAVNALTIARTGGDAIDQKTSIKLPPGCGVRLFSDGANWWTLTAAFTRASGEYSKQAAFDSNGKLIATNASYTTLTDGATITWTLDPKQDNQEATVTLGGNRTLAFSGLAAGMSGTLIVKQDGTGSRTLALPAGSKVISGGAGAVTLTTTASAIDILTWTYDGTNTFWNIGKNYT